MDSASTPSKKFLPVSLYPYQLWASLIFSIFISLISKNYMSLNSCVYLLLLLFLWNDVSCLSQLFFFYICPQMCVYIWILAFNLILHVLCPVWHFKKFYWICDSPSLPPWNLKFLHTHTPTFSFWFQSFKSCLYWAFDHSFIYVYTTLACIYHILSRLFFYL